MNILALNDDVIHYMMAFVVCSDAYRLSHTSRTARTIFLPYALAEVTLNFSRNVTKFWGLLIVFLRGADYVGHLSRCGNCRLVRSVRRY